MKKNIKTKAKTTKPVRERPGQKLTMKDLRLVTGGGSAPRPIRF